MSAQDVIMGSRVAHVRELKERIARLTAENAALKARDESLRAHFDLALIAAMDLRAGEPLEIWDGWNLILGAEKVARHRDEPIAQAKATGRRVWIVFDGPDEKAVGDGFVRVSYTGGEGEHRADRFICQFVRMAHYLGLSHLVAVRTCDKGFLKEVVKLGALQFNGESSIIPHHCNSVNEGKEKDNEKMGLPGVRVCV